MYFRFSLKLWYGSHIIYHNEFETVLYEDIWYLIIVQFPFPCWGKFQPDEIFAIFWNSIKKFEASFNNFLCVFEVVNTESRVLLFSDTVFALISIWLMQTNLTSRRSTNIKTNSFTDYDAWENYLLSNLKRLTKRLHIFPLRPGHNISPTTFFFRIGRLVLSNVNSTRECTYLQIRKKKKAPAPKSKYFEFLADQLRQLRYSLPMGNNFSMVTGNGGMYLCWFIASK